MNEFVRKSWWMIALQGVLALLFGMLAIIVPGATILFLVALFAVWALVGGGSAIVASIRSRTWIAVGGSGSCSASSA